MGIIECKNERCLFHKRKVTRKGFIERCTKSKIHVNEAGICRDSKPKVKLNRKIDNRAIQTLERLKKKAL